MAEDWLQGKFLLDGVIISSESEDMLNLTPTRFNKMQKIEFKATEKIVAAKIQVDNHIMTQFI